MLEFPDEDVPPEESWHHDEQLEDWFKAVKWKREHPDQRPIDDDDDDVGRRTVVNTLVKVPKRR